MVRDEVLQYFGIFLCFLSGHPQIVSKLILTESNTFGVLAVKLGGKYFSHTGKEQIFIWMNTFYAKDKHQYLANQPKIISYGQTYWKKYG